MAMPLFSGCNDVDDDDVCALGTRWSHNAAQGASPSVLLGVPVWFTDAGSRR